MQTDDTANPQLSESTPGVKRCMHMCVHVDYLAMVSERMHAKASTDLQQATPDILSYGRPTTNLRTELAFC